MTAKGRVLVSIPEYYENAGSDYMIGTPYPACSADSAFVKSCYFNQATLTLTIEYEF